MDLIQQSEAKGFMSRDNLIKVNKEYYYLWLCELQKWLREEYRISVSIETGWFGGDFIYEIFIWHDFRDEMIKECFKIYEEALEFGLNLALNLLNNA